MIKVIVDDFKLQDKTDTTNKAFVESPIEGIETPSIRLSSYDKPGASGGFLSNNLYGMRRVTLTGHIWGDGEIEHQTRRRALESVLRLERDSNLVPVLHTLYLTADDGVEYQMEVVLAGLKFHQLSRLVSAFFIDLLAPNYVIESLDLTSVTLSPPSGGGVVIPVVFPMTLAAASNSSTVMTNNGTAEAYPTLTLNGPLTNPYIINETTGRYIKLTMSIATGEQVVIDMADKTIIQGGITNRIAKMTTDSNWWWLEQGDNTIRLITDASEAGTVVVESRNAYVGI